MRASSGFKFEKLICAYLGLWQARQWHPDKNPSKDAHIKFQAISWAYEYLRNPDNRADYDETGVLPQEDEDPDKEGTEEWKNYFDEIFGRVDAQKINEFALKYKMSDEEEADVLKNYERFQGNLSKMLEHVMLSDDHDCVRWCEDYIRPAILSGKVNDYSENLSKSLVRVRKQAVKSGKSTSGKQKHVKDSEKPDTEDSDNVSHEERGEKRHLSKTKKSSRKKVKGEAGDEDALVAAIRARSRGPNPFAALGARYGVSMDDDPIDDETFASLQKKTGRKT